jgi:peroxiredoxin
MVGVLFFPPGNTPLHPVEQRTLFLVLSLTLMTVGHAQRVRGVFKSMPHAPDTVHLLATIGGDLQPVAQARIHANGNFDLGKLDLEAGFYKLGINDTDHVDLILGPNERFVDLEFFGYPLQEHITVKRSAENQALWSYKTISRSHQQAMAGVRAERAAADPADTALLTALDRRAGQLDEGKARERQRIASEHPDSYFTYALTRDAALMEALPKGWYALKSAVDLSDHRLLRSNLHAKAVMAFLRSSPPEQYAATCDSLLSWTASDSMAWCAIRTQLITLFHSYGPDLLAEHLVDTYIAGPQAHYPADEHLERMVQERLRVSIGAQVPVDLELPRPLHGDTMTVGALYAAQDHLLLFFFSSTCGHCHDEMPAVRALAAEADPLELAVVGVSLDEDLVALRGTVQEERLDLPIVCDLGGWGGPVAKAFAITATPAFFVIDRTGVIRAKPFDTQEARMELQRLREGLKTR